MVKILASLVLSFFLLLTGSATCPGNVVNAVDFGVLANGKIAIGATWANASSTITTSATLDPPFSCVNNVYPCSVVDANSDVGKIIFGTTNCNPYNGDIDCNTVAIPQGTITSITSAHVAVISSTTVSPNQAPTSPNSYGPGGFTGWVTWASDDTVGLQNAWAATKGATGQTLVLPLGVSFVSATPFCSTKGTLFGNSITGTGPGFGGTVIVPVPNFTGTCAGGLIYSDPYMGQSPSGDQTFVPSSSLKNFMIWGAGQSGTSKNTTTPVVSLVNSYLENVWVVGWYWHMHNTVNTEAGIAMQGAMLVNSGSWSAGNVGIAVTGNGPVTLANNTINGGLGYSTVGTGLILSGSSTRLSTYGLQMGGGYAVDYGCRIKNGSWSSHGDWFGGCKFTGGVSQLFGDNDTFLGNYGFTIDGGKVMVTSSQVDALIMVSGSFYDLGGNYVSSTGAPYTVSPPYPVTISGGNVWGSGSITGIALSASNLTLSSNWGSTRATSSWSGSTSSATFTITNGSTTTGLAPTISYTFPVPYPQAPLWCSATQVGGTNAFGTFTSSGLSRTGVTFTYSLTPTSNLTEAVQVSCAAQ